MTKKIIFIISIVFGTFVVFTAWFYFPFFNAKSFFVERHDNGFIVESNREEFKTIGSESISSVYEKYYDDVEYRLCDLNPFNLKFCVFLIDSNSYTTLNIYKLNRNFFDVDFVDYRIIFLDDFNMDNSNQIVSQYDFFEDGDFPETILIRNPPSKEQVERNRKSEQQDQAAADSVPEDIKQKMSNLNQEEFRLWGEFVLQAQEDKLELTDDMVRDFLKSIGK